LYELYTLPVITVAKSAELSRPLTVLLTSWTSYLGVYPK